MKHRMFVLALVGTSFVAASTPVAQEARSTFVPVTDAMLQKPAPGDWLMWRRTLDSWGYSPLDQVNRTTVQNLALAWSRPLEPGLQEGTPLVYNGVMYFPNPGNVIQALDARTGDLKWEYRRELPEGLRSGSVAGVNRNLAIYGNFIIDKSSDNQLFALDAASGMLAWEAKILDPKAGGPQTSGPIIANGKAISGRGCQPPRGPDTCVITAHDARTGKELWRTRTIPMPGEPGSDSWGDVPYDLRRHVGTWLVPSYDPELNLVYVGTSVTSPAAKYRLGGNEQQHLYHNSTLALNADTGKIVWYYQHLVDHWDLDHTFERILVDTVVAPSAGEVSWINPRVKPGERRRVLTGIPGKTGIVYTLDRQTGEFLWARPTFHQTVVASIDGATGAVKVNPEMLFHQAGDQRLVCPSLQGGKNWLAGAYSPLTNTMYFPLQNTCMLATATADNSLYGFASRFQITPGTDKVGTVYAISVDKGTTAWKHEQRAATTSLVATGGGLLFGGDVNGRFRAFDQATGNVLWEVNLGSTITGYPISYAVNGKQYIAVSTGTSLATGATRALTPEIRSGNGNNLFVFALPN